MISVVIPAFNEEKNISVCLNSLVSQETQEEYEVIVVDNGSTDDTKKVCEAFDKKLNLKIVAEKKKGRGAARRRGFEEATGDIIASTDADTKLPKNWLTNIHRALQATDAIAATGLSYIDDKNSFKNWVFKSVQFITMLVYRVFFGHYWLSGFNFAVRADVYRATDGFNPQLNALEDIELGFQLKNKGKIICLFKNSVFFSPRRYKNGLFHGLWEYPKVFIKYYVLRDKTPYLSDVR